MRHLWYLRLLYRLYPANSSLPEYRAAVGVVKRYGCRRVIDVGAARCNLGRILLREDLVDLYVGLELFDAPSSWDPRALCVSADARRPPLRGSLDCALFVNSLFYLGLEALNIYSGLARLLVVTDLDPSPRHPLNFLGDLAEGRLRLGYKGLGDALRSMGLRVLESRPGVQYYYVATAR